MFIKRSTYPKDITMKSLAWIALIGFGIACSQATAENATAWTQLSIPGEAGFPGDSLYSLTDWSGHLWAGTDKGVFESADEGKTWQPCNAGLDTLHAAHLTVGNGHLHALTEHGVYRIGDAAEPWAPWSQGIENEKVTSVTANESLSIAVAGHNTRLFLRYPSDTAWHMMQLPRDGLFSSAGIIGGSIFLNGFYFSRSDDGLHWRNITDNCQDPSATIINFENRMLLSCFRSTWIVSANGKDEAWKNIQVPFSNIDLNFRIRKDWVVGTSGFAVVGQFNGVFLSRHKGGSWETTSLPVTPDPKLGYCGIQAGGLAKVGNRLFLANAGHIWVMPDTTAAEAVAIRNRRTPSNARAEFFAASDRAVRSVILDAESAGNLHVTIRDMGGRLAGSWDIHAAGPGRIEKAWTPPAPGLYFARAGLNGKAVPVSLR
jgi:hypothetical protein